MAMLRYQGGIEMGKMGWSRTFSEKVTDKCHQVHGDLSQQVHQGLQLEMSFVVARPLQDGGRMCWSGGG